MRRADLVERLADLVSAVRSEHPVRVAVDGVDGAGKTTLADELAAAVRVRARECIRASIDGFHRPRAERYRRGRWSPLGYYRDSFDLAALQQLLLAPLGPQGSRRYRAAAFDHRADVPVHTGERVAAGDAVLLFDGVFLHRPELRPFWEASIFVRVDLLTAAGRAMHRDRRTGSPGEELRSLCVRRYLPAQHMYVSRLRPEDRADAVVVNDEPERPELVLAPRVG